MQFWSGTPFMKTTEIVAVARMFDEAGYDGLICSDHLIYPRELSSPYPDSPTGRPGWPPETAWPDSWVLIGAMAAVTRRLRFSNAVYIAPVRPLLEVAKQVAIEPHPEAPVPILCGGD
jgi:alkanesulfonate monooxygenase SsuD/methylene tetrahydromethanopterin reductase-like flavin-dependent oxidoreductase (luciferase family)